MVMGFLSGRVCGALSRGRSLFHFALLGGDLSLGGVLRTPVSRDIQARLDRI